MSELAINGTDRMYFSYGQFFVYDSSVKEPGLDWKEAHSRQGFARQETHVAFGTILEFGHALLRVFAGRMPPHDAFDRIVTVPLFVPSGVVHIDGVEEFEEVRTVNVEPGWYRLCAAQRVVESDAEETEEIGLYFMAGRVDESEVLVADEALDPPEPLLERAGTFS